MNTRKLPIRISQTRNGNALVRRLGHRRDILGWIGNGILSRVGGFRIFVLGLRFVVGYCGLIHRPFRIKGVGAWWYELVV